jgi:hypothetical protein
MVVVWFSLQMKMMVEVTVSLIILSEEAMKALCCPYEFFLEGSFGPELTGCLHTVLVTSPVALLLWVVGFDLKPPGVTVYRFTWVWARYTIGVCVFGYDGYYAKGLALRLIGYFMALFLYQHYLRLIGENHEGYALRVLGVIYWPK